MANEATREWDTSSEGDTSSAGPLAGMRVLDVTHVMAGAWCGCLLAQMGADVVKVERKGEGEDLRQAQARTGGAFRPYDAVNHGKRSLAVDLDDPRGAEIIASLAKEFDVFLENYRPGAMDRRGLGADRLCAENPRLIYCSVSAFGSTGPYRDRPGFDLIAQAMSGILSLTGEQEGTPVAAGVPVSDLNAGTLAAMGILSAWIERLRSGKGQKVETSLFEAAIAYTIWESAMYFDLGAVAKPNGSRHRLASPYRTFATSDGWIAVGAGTQPTWKRLCEAVDRPDLLDDERFASPLKRLEHRAALEADLENVFRGKSTTAWVRQLDATGVPCGPVQGIDQMWNDPQTLARDMLAEDPAAPERPRKVIGPAVKLSRTPWQARPEASTLGEHTFDVLQQAGWRDDDINDLIAAGVIEVKGDRNA